VVQDKGVKAEQLPICKAWQAGQLEEVAPFSAAPAYHTSSFRLTPPY
jgi:hypothetical protein